MVNMKQEEGDVNMRQEEKKMYLEEEGELNMDHFRSR